MTRLGDHLLTKPVHRRIDAGPDVQARARQVALLQAVRSDDDVDTAAGGVRQMAEFDGLVIAEEVALAADPIARFVVGRGRAEQLDESGRADTFFAVGLQQDAATVAHGDGVILQGLVGLVEVAAQGRWHAEMQDVDGFLIS